MMHASNLCAPQHPCLHRPRVRPSTLVATCLLALSGLVPIHASEGAAAAAPGSTGIDASGNYQQEMQACRQGRTAQDRATCMEEAREARKAMKRGALNTPAQSMGANTMARCEGMNNADMAACRARMMGYGQTSGSVAGGGVLRELEVVEVPPGQDSVNIAPKGNTPVLVVPAPSH
jgi:hypothetical protein